METIQLTILPILLLAIMYISGLGLSSYVFNDFKEEFRFIIAPVIGTAAIACIMSLFFILGLTGIQASLITSTCLIIIDIIRAKHIVVLIKSLRPPFLIFSLISLIFLYITLTPLYKLGYATTTSYFVGDSSIYIPSADFLTNNSIYNKPSTFYQDPLSPLSDVRSATLGQFYTQEFYRAARWGTPAILTYFQVMSRHNSVQIFCILSSLFYIISGLLVYAIIGSYIKKTNVIVSVLLSFFYLFNYLLFWIAINGQIAQTIVTPLFLSIIYLTSTNNLFQKKTSKKLWLGFSLISNTILLIYAQYAPFIFIPFTLYLFWKFIQNKNIKKGLLLISLIFVNPFCLFSALKSTLLFSKILGTVGINMPNLNLYEILGFSNAIIKPEIVYSIPENVFIILILISFLGTLLYLLLKKTHYFVFSIIYLLLFFVIKYKFYTSYTLFKYITYILPFILVCYLLFIKFLYFRYKKFRPLLIIFLAFCLYIQFTQLNLLLTKLNQKEYVVSKKYQSLWTLIDNTDTRKITYLNNTIYWSKHWIKYYLQNNAVYFTDEVPTIIQPYILVDYSENYPSDYIVSGNIMLSNDYYRLYKPYNLLLLDNQTWYPKGDNEKEIPYRWMNQNGVMFIYVDTPGKYELSFDIVSFLKNRHIDIKLNNSSLLKNYKTTQAGTTLNLQLNLFENKNTLSIYPLEAPDKPPMSPDQRKLSIQIANIKFNKK